MMFLVATVVGLMTVACRPASAMPPRSFATPMEISSDTLKISFSACNASAPTVGCQVVLSGTVGSTAINFPTIANLGIGESKIVTTNIICTDRAPISVTVTSKGLNADGIGSTASTTVSTGTGMCSAGGATAPLSFQVTITVVKGP